MRSFSTPPPPRRVGAYAMRLPASAPATPACIRSCAAIGRESPAAPRMRMNSRRRSAPRLTRPIRERSSSSSTPFTVLQACHAEHREIERRPLALDQVGDDLAHHRSELEAVTRAHAGDDHRVMARMAIDEEMEIRRVGVEALFARPERAVGLRQPPREEGAQVRDVRLAVMARDLAAAAEIGETVVEGAVRLFQAEDREVLQCVAYGREMRDELALDAQMGSQLGHELA